MGNCLPCAREPFSKPIKQASVEPDAHVNLQPLAQKEDKIDLAAKDASVKARAQAPAAKEEKSERDAKALKQDKMDSEAKENLDPDVSVKPQTKERSKPFIAPTLKVAQLKIGGRTITNSTVRETKTTVEQIFQEASNGRIFTCDELRRQRRQLKLKNKDIDNLEQQALALLDDCKGGQFEQALEKVRTKPLLASFRPESQQYAAIHEVASSGNLEVLQELLQLKASPLAQTTDGKTALEVAQERGHSEMSELLLQSEGDACAARPHLKRTAPAGGKMRSYDASYARALCIVPLIGDRHMNKELDKAAMQHIADSLRSEAKSLRVGTKAYSDKNGGEIDFCDLIEQASASEMTSTLIFVHTLDSFVSKEVDTAARLRREQRTNLAPYMRGLHDALLTGDSLERFSGTAYRVMNMDIAVAQSYRPSTVDVRCNLFSWEGFTTAVTTPQTAYSNFQVFGANVLVIIEQGCGDHPVLLSKLSEFPHEEQVMYALGQSFKKRDYFTKSAGEVWSELGVTEGSKDQAEVIVIKLSAEDAFYDVAQDLLPDSDHVPEALPILKARLAFEKDRKSPWEARAHKELGGAYVQIAQYELAMEHYQVSLQQFAERGDPRDIATLKACIAHVLERQLKYQEALELHQEVLKVYEPEASHSDADAQREIGKIYLSMGRIHTKRAEEGDWEEALKLFGEAEKISRQHVGDVSIEVATAANYIGEVYHRQNKLSEAVRKYEKTLQIKEAILGYSHPDVALVLLDLGACYRDKRRYDVAIKTLERARQIYVRAYGPEAITVADVYMQLLPVYNDAGQIEDMKEKAEFCHRIYLEHLGSEHSSTATAEAWMDFAKSA